MPRISTRSAITSSPAPLRLPSAYHELFPVEFPCQPAAKTLLISSALSDSYLMVSAVGIEPTTL